VNLYDTIPNNVDLSEDPRLKRALEKWLPDYQAWWMDMGPEGFQQDDVYLRTAISVDPKGWAHFDHVKMPDYRWGIFLAEPVPDRKVGFGDHMGQPAWTEVPGEYRGMLRRLIVTQGDTEPASVEQQRMLGQTCPSLYDLRNLFQVNVEEGRHLWAMVYLLHGFFGRDGREEAEALLQRRSGNPDKPRILGAFNEPIQNWLDFYMFTTFTDRDGKYQLLALAESGFDPLSRTTRFMLTEEAHHMFVGETGVGRVVERTCQIMKESPGEDVRKQGGIDLPTIQKFLNFWFSVSVDLFGGEKSSNAADYFASGLKGRYREETFEDHVAMEGTYSMALVEGDKLVTQEVPLRNAMNEILRDAYIEDCQKGVDRWNKVLAKNEMGLEFKLPHRRFNRAIGAYEGMHFDPEGQPLCDDEWNAKRGEWLPSDADRGYVKSLMQPVTERGKIANWLAPPTRGINGQLFEYEYVRRA
jgi:benzoyl-CoA 2,3-dioxygenase component B